MNPKQEDNKKNKTFEPRLLIHQGNEIDANQTQQQQQQQTQQTLQYSLNKLQNKPSQENLSNIDTQSTKNNNNADEKQIMPPKAISSFSNRNKYTSSHPNLVSQNSMLNFSQDQFNNMGQIPSRNSENNLFQMQQRLSINTSQPNLLALNNNNNMSQTDLMRLYPEYSYDNLLKLSDPNFMNNGNNQGNNDYNNQSLNASFGYAPQQGQFGFNQMGMPISLSNPNLQNLNNNNGQSQDQSFLQLQSIKGNVKNTYIKKISNILHSNTSLDQLPNNNNPLMNKDEDDSEDEDQSFDNFDSAGNMNNNQGQNTDQNNGQNPQFSQKKQRKNRESARNSRQRKKIYIDLLEKKVQDLNNQIGSASEYLTRNWNLISHILELTPYLRFQINWRHNFTKKMQKQLQLASVNQVQDQEQLGMIIDSHRLRLGATGVLRTRSIKFLFQHLLRSFLCNTCPYFLFGYSPDQQHEDEEYNQCVQIFKDFVGLTDSSQIYKALPVLRNLISHREKFRNTVIKVYKIQRDMQKTMKKIEFVLDNFSVYLDSSQIGKLMTKSDHIRKHPLFSMNVKRSYSKLEPVNEDEQFQANPKFSEQNLQNFFDMYRNYLDPGQSQQNNQNSFLPNMYSNMLGMQQQQQQQQQPQQQQQQFQYQQPMEQQQQKQMQLDSQMRLQNFGNFNSEKNQLQQSQQQQIQQQFQTMMQQQQQQQQMDHNQQYIQTQYQQQQQYTKKQKSSDHSEHRDTAILDEIKKKVKTQYESNLQQQQ